MRPNIIIRSFGENIQIYLDHCLNQVSQLDFDLHQSPLGILSDLVSGDRAKAATRHRKGENRTSAPLRILKFNADGGGNDGGNGTWLHQSPPSRRNGTGEIEGRCLQGRHTDDRSFGVRGLFNEGIGASEVTRFGPIIARNLRETRPKAHSRWHFDEIVVSIAGRQMYMWRAVDSEGEVFEILVQPNATRPETASTSGLCSDGYHHRQAEILRSGASQNWLLGFARARTARQQSSGELASTAPTTRTKNARFQISQIGSALCFRPCGGLQHIQRSAAFDPPTDTSTVSDRSA
jgi:DDE domain